MNKKYQIWIESNVQKLLLPVNPPKIEIKMQGNNKSMTIPELGELTIPQSPKALTLAFSSFLPARPYYFSDYSSAASQVQNISLSDIGDYNGDGMVNVRDLAAAARDSSGNSDVSSNVLKVMPHYYINFFLNLMSEKQPCRVYIIGCDFIHFMTIESFTYSQKGGEVGGYDYSISFKLYREIAVRQIQVKKNTAQLPKKTEKRVSTAQKPKTYKVQKGDCLWNIAKKYYGDGSKYTKIYDANKKIIGANPNIIKIGMVLTIP